MHNEPLGTLAVAEQLSASHEEHSPMIKLLVCFLASVASGQQLEDRLSVFRESCQPSFASLLIVAAIDLPAVDDVHSSSESVEQVS